MKKKPILFNFYTLFFLTVAISFPVQIMSLYGHAPTEVQMIVNKMSVFNWSVIFVCALNAFLSFKGHWLLSFTLPSSFFVVACNNFFVSKLATDYSSLITTAATLTFGLISSYIFFSEAKQALSNQDNRWWLAPKRLKRSLPVWVQGPMGSPLLSKTFDISSSGAFLSAPALAQINQGLMKPLNKGDEISLTLGLSGQEEFSCQAEVVRLSTPRGDYPGGVGIRFKDLTMANRWLLGKILKDTMTVSSL